MAKGGRQVAGNRDDLDNSGLLMEVTLSVIGLRSVRCSTVGVPNIERSGVFLGSQRGLSELLNGSLGLSVTVGLAANPSKKSTKLQDKSTSSRTSLGP